MEKTLSATQKPASGALQKPTLAATAGSVELFGHVTLVEGYDVWNYQGCHALVSLRDTPGSTVAVLTYSTRLQSLLETALETGNLVAFRGTLLANPPTPLGGTWGVPVYGNLTAVIVYNS